MAGKESIEKKIVNKDAALGVITTQLKTALPGLKEQLGDKKFEKRIKKAAKLLLAGFKKSPVKKEKPAAKKVIPVAKKPAPALKKAISPAKKSVKTTPKN